MLFPHLSWLFIGLLFDSETSSQSDPGTEADRITYETTATSTCTTATTTTEEEPRVFLLISSGWIMALFVPIRFLPSANGCLSKVSIRRFGE